MFGIGLSELLIVTFVAWMLFGKHLPNLIRLVGRNVAQLPAELQRGMQTAEAGKDQVSN